MVDFVVFAWMLYLMAPHHYRAEFSSRSQKRAGRQQGLHRSERGLSAAAHCF